MKNIVISLLASLPVAPMPSCPYRSVRVRAEYVGAPAHQADQQRQLAAAAGGRGLHDELFYQRAIHAYMTMQPH